MVVDGLPLPRHVFRNVLVAASDLATMPLAWCILSNVVSGSIRFPGSALPSSPIAIEIVEHEHEVDTEGSIELGPRAPVPTVAPRTGVWTLR
jgi:hypothetical protein